MLISTSAIREYKRRNPDTPIIYRTYTANRHARYQLEYENGYPAELLYGNTDIDYIEDITTPYDGPRVPLRYAWFGGPSLDYPIQAHFWECLGMAWERGQRFDAILNLSPAELAWGRDRLANYFEDRPTLAISTHTGWPGKGWSTEGWNDLVTWALGAGYGVVTLAGAQTSGIRRGGVLNLEGQLGMRQTAAILAAADHAVLIEGGLSNIRFALGRPVILLTCATQVGLQIWTPPELTTEIRMRSKGYRGDVAGTVGWPSCEPCMWRREHPKRTDADVAPATIRHCPPGRSLRDIPATVVIEHLERIRNEVVV